MAFPRSSGILLHPTSFPSPFGIGDLGPEAYRFVDFLVDSGQQIWQILPLGPTGYGNSPYMCYSAMAGNPLLISLEKLIEEELLADWDVADVPDFPLDSVDFDRVRDYKMAKLRIAFNNFKTQAKPKRQKLFEKFCDRAVYWLEDYTLFMALKTSAFQGESWNNWPADIAKRKPHAITKWKQELASEIEFHKFLQFEFFRQWLALKRYTNELNIQILGDIPIYVAHDSADVWAHPEIFSLDEKTGAPKMMAGVPPDYFSATGQLWGNPVYNWEQLEKDDFGWWLQRFHAILDMVDLIRIDHFRGFESYWAVPGDEETAMNGKWVEAPGEAFFHRLNRELGKLPIIAEDLGIITPEVEALRDKFGFPGMKILHFAFDSGPGNPYLPYNYHSQNFVVYTGTHDNNTTVGWFEARSPDQQQWVWDFLGCSTGHGIHWDLIRLAMSSNANQAIFPFQDLLGLGANARMNEPSEAEGNWGWRYRQDSLVQEFGDRLRWLTGVYGRFPQKQESSS